MLFYESGRRGYLIMDTNGEIPSVGYHMEKGMAGLWFPPLKLLKGMKIENLKDPLLVVTKSGRKLRDGDTTVEILIPVDDEELFISITTEGGLKLTIELCSTPVWKSEEVGLNYSIDELKRIDESTFSLRLNESKRYYLMTTDHLVETDHLKFTVSITGSGVLYIGGRRYTDLHRAFVLKKKEKEEYYLERIGSRNDLDTHLKKFLLEMFLSNEYGRGVIAGFPEYPWWFGIDTFFIGEALLRYELYDLLRDSILNLLNHSKCGMIPHEIVNNGYVNHPGYPLETLLIIVLLEDYFLRTGNADFVKMVYWELRQGLKKLLKQIYPRGPSFVELEETSNGEIQSLDTAVASYACCRSLLKLSKLLDDPEMKGFLGDLMEYYQKRFLRDWYSKKHGVFYDYFRGREKVIGYFFIQLFPLFFRIVDERIARTVFENLKKVGLICDDGLLHSIHDDPKDGFYMGKSHKVWWIANAMLKKCVKEYDLNYDLERLDERFIDDVENEGMPHVPPEIVGNPTGCFAQTWSALYWVV